MKKEPIGVKGPMKKSEVYSSGSNLFAHKPVLTRKDSRPIKGGGEMDSPEGATIIFSLRNFLLRNWSLINNFSEKAGFPI